MCTTRPFIYAVENYVLLSNINLYHAPYYAKYFSGEHYVLVGNTNLSIMLSIMPSIMLSIILVSSVLVGNTNLSIGNEGTPAAP